MRLDPENLVYGPPGRKTHRKGDVGNELSSGLVHGDYHRRLPPRQLERSHAGLHRGPVPEAGAGCVHEATQYRYEHRENYFREQYPGVHTIKQWRHDLWESKNRGNKVGDEEGEEEPEGAEDGADSDEADWLTDDDEAEWEGRPRDSPPAGQQAAPLEEDLEWGPQADIRLAT